MVFIKPWGNQGKTPSLTPSSREASATHGRLPTTNGFTEGCHTKIKLLKRLSYGYRNVQVYIGKMLLGFLPTSLPTLAPHILT